MRHCSRGRSLRSPEPSAAAASSASPAPQLPLRLRFPLWGGARRPGPFANYVDLFSELQAPPSGAVPVFVCLNKFAKRREEGAGETRVRLFFARQVFLFLFVFERVNRVTSADCASSLESGNHTGQFCTQVFVARTQPRESGVRNTAAGGMPTAARLRQPLDRASKQAINPTF